MERRQGATLQRRSRDLEVCAPGGRARPALAALLGAWLLATTGAAASPPLVLGNEVRGVSDALASRAARRVGVPQRGRADSLNVAMAGSVLLSWIAERRGGTTR